MSSVKASELSDYTGKVVVVQLDIDPALHDGDTLREVTGKCIVGNETGLVVQVRSGGTEMFMVKDIIDVDVISKPKNNRIVRRWIDEVEIRNVRQHMLDRHGADTEVVRALSPADALTLHNLVAHSKLGHEHGVKPPGRPGPPRLVRKEIGKS